MEQTTEQQTQKELSHDEKIILLKQFIGEEITEILIKTYTPEFLEQYLNDNLKILMKTPQENLSEVKRSFEKGEVKE